MKVRIDSRLCTGHGRCYSLAPGVFAPDDDGYGTVPADEVGEDLVDQALAGARNCPERAVVVEE
jgi:ferredoxin